jgi:hypothetical protein
MPSPNQVTLLNKAIPAAGTYVTDAYYIGKEAHYLAAQINFVRDAGGTSIKAYVQTTFDEANWCDIICFALTTTSARRVSAVVLATALAANITPTDGTLTDNTILSGLLGSKIRIKYVVVGTYTDSTVRLDLVLR